MKIQLIELPNRLLDKMGLVKKDDLNVGQVDPKGIAEAERMVENLKKECPAAISGYLEELTKAWEDMRDLPDNDERAELSERIFTLAHEIKDLAVLSDAHLTAYFSESLRDYIGETELNLEAQRVIIQAHVDAMTVVNKQQLKDAEGEMAEELKGMVKIAIDKYK
ncbi:MAG: hypothetical protein AAF569_03815 [Pseudomonadota bacterium]